MSSNSPVVLLATTCAAPVPHTATNQKKTRASTSILPPVSESATIQIVSPSHSSNCRVRRSLPLSLSRHLGIHQRRVHRHRSQRLRILVWRRARHVPRRADVQAHSITPSTCLKGSPQHTIARRPIDEASPTRSLTNKKTTIHSHHSSTCICLASHRTSHLAVPFCFFGTIRLASLRPRLVSSELFPSLLYPLVHRLGDHPSQLVSRTFHSSLLRILS